MKNGHLLLVLVALLINNPKAVTQTIQVTKYEDVVYGFVDGLSLLMDVYQPENNNHLGVIYIAGSGWGSPAIWNDIPLKDIYYDTAYAGLWPQGLLKKGYTVFIINHRFAPRYHFPEILSDCQRAVRYVRYHAKKYDIHPDKIGVMGHSSGAYLSSMLGVKDTSIINPKNGIDSVSSRVQAVVALAAPFILSDYNMKSDTAVQTSRMMGVLKDYMGELPQEKNGEFILSGKYKAASPITYINNDDAAFLIYYSDDDPLIPPRQAQLYFNLLESNKVPAKIVVCHNCKHQPIPDMDEVDAWFKKYLK